MRKLPDPDLPLHKNGSVEGSIEKSAPRRISVNLPEPTAIKLDDFARSQGVSTSEAARISIRRDLQIRSLEEKGGKLLVEMPDGKTAYLLPEL